MFTYYLKLAVRSLKRNKALTVLMVLTIAVGIGATMTTLTVFRTLSANPIPQKSDVLFHVQVDPEPMDGYHEGIEPEKAMSRFDAEALLAGRKAPRQSINTGGRASLELPDGSHDPSTIEARYATADFFPMFLVPMRYGQAWSATQDDARARVAVVSSKFNDKFFGGSNSVGKTIRLDGQPFQIIGVMEPWRPAPRYYDNYSDTFGGIEHVMLPFSTSRELKMARNGNMNCYAEQDPGVDEGDLAAKCVWLQYWVELAKPSDATAYKDYLDSYSVQQKAGGRFKRPPNTRLRNVTEWLDFTNAVPSDIKLQTWLALGFLLVCLVNVVGLLLAKFLRRSSELGVRRALGASRRNIFLQLLTEAGVIGSAGGVLGLALAWLGMVGVRHLPAQYADLARMDATMLLATIILAIVVTLLAGLIPAWRAMQIAPAIQLKSQ